MTAAAPSRASFSGTIGFGLVSIPVQVYAGSQSLGISRSEFIKNDDGTYAKVGRASVNKDVDPVVIVDTANVVKLFECEDGSLVELSDEEIENLVEAQNGRMQIVSFMPLNLLGSGRYVPTGINQVRPVKTKTRAGKVYEAGAARSFALLMAAMRKNQVFALVEQCARGRYSFSALMPTGRLLPLLLDDEVREDLPMPDVEVSDAELGLADNLMDALMSSTPVPLVDERTAKVVEYAQKKAGGKKVEVTETVTPAAPTDLLQALQAAVDAQKAKV